MNKAKFTKGNWKIVKGVAFDNDLGNIGETSMLVIGSRVFPICHQGVQGECVDYNEQIANAHLIIAAPEMYEMLSFIAASPMEACAKTEEIKELLAKARGVK